MTQPTTAKQLIEGVRVELKALRAKVTDGQITEAQAQESAAAIVRKAFDRMPDEDEAKAWTGGFSASRSTTNQG